MAEADRKSMVEIMALCKRRGFIFPASDIYGGIAGFWDYGPLGAQLKKNLRDAWWDDMVVRSPIGPDGEPVSIVGLDSTIIQNPKVWEASGHVAGFSDPMVDCRKTKLRYRADHLVVFSVEGTEQTYAAISGDDDSEARAVKLLAKYARRELSLADVRREELTQLSAEAITKVVGPDTKEVGTLTEPRAFNLMFRTFIGATAGADDVAYLRPETAQGIFCNFKNVVDTSRVKVPFGIAQAGKAFRNEVTPRNFTFRSREFEQMEIEFFCAPDQTKVWYSFWRELRVNWWKSVGLSGENLRVREHDRDELAHYAKTGAGTSDVEYRFPFTYPEFGELEGVADRSNFDLTQHMNHSKTKLEYFDAETKERFVPHVIEPSAGLDRGVLAILCEAYTPDPERASKVYMKFAPRIAPIKAAVFPLINKEGMPEIASALYAELRREFGHIEYDAKQSIGKRYARMDEAGCPFCITIDGETANDQSVTIRDRDTLAQHRVALTQVVEFLREKLR